jgi:hypothetical protein
MALLKVVQMVNETEAIVKVSGNSTSAAVIDIATDILSTGQTVSGTPVVNIIGFQWAGEPGAIYQINRNTVRVASLLADNGNFMDFVELFPSENTENTSNVSVNIVKSDGSAVQGEVWIRLRKVSGFVIPPLV